MSELIISRCKRKVIPRCHLAITNSAAHTCELVGFHGLWREVCSLKASFAVRDRFVSLSRIHVGFQVLKFGSVIEIRTSCGVRGVSSSRDERRLRT